jgi:hypothetical protein
MAFHPLAKLEVTPGMYVNPLRTPALNAGKAKTARKAGSGFEGMIGSDAEASGTQATRSATPMQATSAIFALQEINDPVGERRAAVQSAHSILDELDRLKVDLLSGQISEDRLTRILSLVQKQKESNDPALKDLIAEIELRAEVELAKLGRFSR